MTLSTSKEVEERPQHHVACGPYKGPDSGGSLLSSKPYLIREEDESFWL